MSSCCEANFNEPCNSKFVGRNDFLFTAAAIAVIVGFLFPIPARLFDILLIFSLCLTATVLLITLSAKQVLAVLGFPWLIVLATSVRLSMSTACTRLIFSRGDIGIISHFFGSTFVGQNYLLSLMVFFVSATFIFAVICKSVRSIIRNSSGFIVNTAPFKQISVNSDLSGGLLSNEQAVELKENIRREINFFVTMSGVGRFIFCAALFELVIVIINIIGAIIIGLSHSSGGLLSVKSYATLVIGAGFLTQISALVIAAASRHLVRKSTSTSLDANSANQQSKKRVKVVAREVKRYPPQKPQNKNAEDYSQSIKNDKRSSEEKTLALENKSNIEKKTVVEDIEWVDKQTVNKQQEADLSLWQWQEIKNKNIYVSIVESIELLSSENKIQTILTAAESTKELGVTVPVNIAMRLAQREKKCLLIDLDLQRAAVSKVFDISEQNSTKVQTSCISNLWVLQCSNLRNKNDSLNLKEIIGNVKNQYDYLIIYAPNIKLLKDSEQLADCADIALLFGEKGEDRKVIENFRLTLSCSGCRILEPQKTASQTNQNIVS